MAGVKRVVAGYYCTIAAWVYVVDNYRERCDGMLVAKAYAILLVRHEAIQVARHAIPVLAEVTADLKV